MKKVLLANIAPVALGSITSLHGVFIFYLLITLLIGVWRTVRFAAPIEQAKECFLQFQPKDITHHITVSFSPQKHPQ